MPQYMTIDDVRNEDYIDSRDLIELRNAAIAPDDAAFFHATGDVYLLRAMALSEEWS